MMEGIFASAHSPFYEFAVKMNLSIIDRAELFTYIQEKFTQYNLDKKAKQLIVYSNYQIVSHIIPNFLHPLSLTRFGVVMTWMQQTSRTAD